MGKYEGEKINSYSCVFRFNNAHNIAGVIIEMFSPWCEEVKDVFISRNMVSLPVKMCKHMPGVMIKRR